MKPVDNYHPYDIELYIYGSQDAAAEGQTFEAVTGRVIKAVRRCDICEWSDEILSRLQQPTKWNPHFEKPGAREGLHTVCQAVKCRLGRRPRRP